MTKRIPVSQPSLVGNEKTYVLDCLDTTWISSLGKYIDSFESKFAGYCKTKHAIACSNGTTALHLALMALDIGPGDEVIVPTLTFVSTANAVVYCGATPVFVDSDTDTWNISPAQIEAKITPRTKAIIPVHLYGQPADMDAIMAIAKKHHLSVIEDAAEAHGATYKGRPVGSIGDLAIFSFYGNKIITTGEGGMVTTNDDRLAQEIRQLKGQGMDPKKRYWFPIIGYNYRMTNIQAAIGLAQLEKIEWHLAERARVAETYKAHLKDVDGISFQSEIDPVNHVYWMFSILFENDSLRDQIMSKLDQLGIETRPIFYPIHTLPPYAKDNTQAKCPNAMNIASRGINLPTWSGLSNEDIEYVCQSLKNILVKQCLS